MQALEALRQYTCENSGSLMGGVAHLINTSASLVIAPRIGIGTLGSGAGNAVGGLSRLGSLGLAVAGGIGAATGAIILWDELTQPYEQEGDDAIPIPMPKNPARRCSETYPNLPKCYSLPYSYQYRSPQAALNALKQISGIRQLSLHNQQVTYRGPCPNIGTHYNVRYRGQKYGSIGCCPCCEETSVGPNSVTKCRII